MDREIDLFDAHLKANTVAAHFLQAHALKRYSGRESLSRREAAIAELDKLAALFGMVIVPRTDVTLSR